MTYTSWRFWLICEWKRSFDIGSWRYVEYIEKKPNFTILTSLKSQIFFISHGSQHSTLSQKTFLASPLKLPALNWWSSGPIKKSLKWGQCLKVFNFGRFWSQLTELFRGRCHLNISILGLRFNNFYVSEGPIKSLLSLDLSIQHFC